MCSIVPTVYVHVQHCADSALLMITSFFSCFLLSRSLFVFLLLLSFSFTLSLCLSLCLSLSLSVCLFVSLFFLLLSGVDSAAVGFMNTPEEELLCDTTQQRT